jgi:hypothetical protein
MVLMPPLRSLVVCGLVVLAACHFEDHTPAGSRRDEAQIREVIIEYYRSYSARDWASSRKYFADGAMVSYPADSMGQHVKVATVPADSLFLSWARATQDGSFPPPQAQILRADLRQVEGTAAVWVTIRQTVAPAVGDPARQIEDQEHWVLQRTGDGWRAVFLTLPWTPR